MKIKELIDDFVFKVSRERQRHLEMMAAAFLKETNLRPSQVELVEYRDDEQIIYFYRKRNS